MYKGLHRARDAFYSPTFELFVDQRTLEPLSPDASRKGDTMHWHDYCEVEFVVSGHGIHRRNQHTESLLENSVYLVTPMDFHCVLPTNDAPLQLYHVQFGCSVPNSALMQRITQAQQRLPFGISAHLSGEEVRLVRESFEQLLDEFTARRPDGISMMRACLERLCIFILRAAERAANFTSDETHISEGNAVNQVIQSLQYNFRSPVTLAEMARQVHLSPNYLGELFRRQMGETFNEYLRRLRIDYAAQLLTETELNVSEIAGESGFRSLAYFSEIFKRRYGATPTQYKHTKCAESEKNL